MTIQDPREHRATLPAEAPCSECGETIERGWMDIHVAQAHGLATSTSIEELRLLSPARLRALDTFRRELELEVEQYRQNRISAAGGRPVTFELLLADRLERGIIDEREERWILALRALAHERLPRRRMARARRVLATVRRPGGRSHA